MIFRTNQRVVHKCGLKTATKLQHKNPNNSHTKSSVNTDKTKFNQTKAQLTTGVSECVGFNDPLDT